MTKCIVFLFFLIPSSIVTAQNVAINNNGQAPNESAMLHVESNSKGIIIPRMTSTERQNIINPANGLMVYDVSTAGFWYYTNNSWKELLNDDRIQNLYMDGDSIKITEGNSSVAINNISHWEKSGDNLRRTIGNVGIRSLNPISALHVEDALQVSGVYGAGDSLISPGNVPRMFFYPRKGAIRAGGVFADQWDEPNLGNYSTAMGFSTSAQGDFGVSLGYYNEAEGDYSVALGRTSHAEKDYSVAIGHSVWSYSPYEIALGSWNTSYSPVSSINWDPNDRLLVVGNGTDNANRSDAMTILKNGKIGFGTSTPQADVEIVGSAINTDALLWDDGQAALGHSSDLLRTNRQWLNLLIDADNSQSNAHFAIYNDSTASNGLPLVKFHLDGGDSWINSGNVGIGTTSPSALLQVSGDAKIDGQTFNVDAVNNRVGIGTDSPDTKLHVAGGMKVDGPTFNIDAVNNRVGIGTITPTADLEISGATGSEALIWDSGNASLVHGQDLIRTKRDFINILLDTDNDGSNARLRLFSDIGVNSGTPPISFGLDGDSWITSGNLGIGITNPSADLEIVGTPETAAIELDDGNIELRHGEDFIVTNNSGLNILIDANNNNTVDAVRFYNNTSNSGGGDPIHKISMEDNSKTYFYPSFNNQGSVGFHTSDPQKDLHLMGIFRIESIFNWWDIEPSIFSLELHSEDGGGLVGEWDKDTGVYTALSDSRAKRKISPLTGALSKIEALQPKTYQYKTEEDDAPFSIGFLAQEVESILPGAVRYNEKNDRYTLDYGSFGVLAIQAIKEQQETIESLEERITNLESALLKRTE